MSENGTTGTNGAKPDPNLKRIWRQSRHDSNGQIAEVTKGNTTNAIKKGAKEVFIKVGAPIPTGTEPGDIIRERVWQKATEDGATGASGASGPKGTWKVIYSYFYDSRTTPAAKKEEDLAVFYSGVLTLNDTGTSQFNPPPHKASRPIPPTAFANYSTSSSADVNSITYLQKANRRGFFYQDIDNAYDADGEAKTKASKLWGFQFMYNPQTISHTQANANFDITNTADISNQLTGSQTFEVEILLNRLFDMSILSSDAAKQKTTQGDYARALKQDDIHGILNRGTEYDLEFLYRVINGEPKLGPSMEKATSDFGFLAPAPIWFRLHNNFKYKVVVTSIAVNHTMFTEKMIPVMTGVRISMMRIPTPDYDSTSSDEFLATRYTHSGVTSNEVTSNSKLPVYGSPSDTEATK